MRYVAALIVCGLGVVGCSNSQHAANHEKHEECCGLEGSALVSATQPTEAAKPKAMATFGAQQKLTDAEAVPAAKVLSDPEKYKDQYVRITGKVSAVCEKKGCWLRVVPAQAAKPGDAAALSDIFIKFQDPPAGRLVPMEAVGHDVTVEGTVKVGMMPERAARHFKEDAGASKEEIEKIVGPQKQMVIAGAGVAIEGVEKSAN